MARRRLYEEYGTAWLAARLELYERQVRNPKPCTCGAIFHYGCERLTNKYKWHIPRLRAELKRRTER